MEQVGGGGLEKGWSKGEGGGVREGMEQVGGREGMEQGGGGGLEKGWSKWGVGKGWSKGEGGG